MRSVDHLPLRNGAAGGRGPREGWGRRPLRRPLWLWECSDNMGVRGPRSPGAPSLIHIALEVSHRRGGEARWDWRPPLGGHTGSIHSCALVPYCGARAGRREGSCTTTPSRLCGAPRLMGNAVYLRGRGDRVHRPKREASRGSRERHPSPQRLTGTFSLGLWGQQRAMGSDCSTQDHVIQVLHGGQGMEVHGEGIHPPQRLMGKASSPAEAHGKGLYPSRTFVARG